MRRAGSKGKGARKRNQVGRGKQLPSHAMQGEGCCFPGKPGLEPQVRGGKLHGGVAGVACRLAASGALPCLHRGPPGEQAQGARRVLLSPKEPAAVRGSALSKREPRYVCVFGAARSASTGAFASKLPSRFKFAGETLSSASAGREGAFSSDMPTPPGHSSCKGDMPHKANPHRRHNKTPSPVTLCALIKGKGRGSTLTGCFHLKGWGAGRGTNPGLGGWGVGM